MKNKLLFLLFVSLYCNFSTALAQSWNSDWIGLAQVSTDNYTDLVSPYDGFDAWSEFKVTYWWNSKRKWSAYGSFLPSFMSYLDPENGATPFHWQRYLQLGGGIQFYPFFKKGDYNPSFGIRLFLYGGGRYYYGDDDFPSVAYSDKSEWDAQAGADYYFDNITDHDAFISLFAWTNATFRYTGFSHSDFKVVLWTGNVRVGPRLQWGTVSFVPNLSVDWTLTNKCGCRWWENYYRLAGGVKIYPFNKKKPKGTWAYLQRVHLFADYYYHNNWLQEAPANGTSSTDLRFGISFSTPGFFRQED